MLSTLVNVGGPEVATEVASLQKELRKHKRKLADKVDWATLATDNSAIARKTRRSSKSGEVKVLESDETIDFIKERMSHRRR